MIELNLDHLTLPLHFPKPQPGDCFDALCKYQDSCDATICCNAGRMALVTATTVDKPALSARHARILNQHQTELSDSNKHNYFSESGRSNPFQHIVEAAAISCTSATGCWWLCASCVGWLQVTAQTRQRYMGHTTTHYALFFSFLSLLA